MRIGLTIYFRGSRKKPPKSTEKGLFLEKMPVKSTSKSIRKGGDEAGFRCRVSGFRMKAERLGHGA